MRSAGLYRSPRPQPLWAMVPIFSTKPIGERVEPEFYVVRWTDPRRRPGRLAVLGTRRRGHCRGRQHRKIISVLPDRLEVVTAAGWGTWPKASFLRDCATRRITRTSMAEPRQRKMDPPSSSPLTREPSYKDRQSLPDLPLVGSRVLIVQAVLQSLQAIRNGTPILNSHAATLLQLARIGAEAGG